MAKTRGIVLRSVRYGDDGMIVDIFTEEQGTVSFFAKVTHGKRSALHAVLLRPLSVLELEYDFRTRLQLQRIRNMQLHVNYRSMTFHPLKATIAIFLGEFLSQALRHEDCNPPLFSYLLNSLVWLDEAEDGYANFHLTFLIRLTRFLGFWPQVDHYAEGQFFDMEGCQFTGIPPRREACLLPREAALVPVFLRMNFSNMHLYIMSREQRGRALELLLRFYRLHVPEFHELRSVEVLREVLS